jgi:hypothetical protein
MMAMNAQVAWCSSSESSMQQAPLQCSICGSAPAGHINAINQRPVFVLGKHYPMY